MVKFTCLQINTTDIVHRYVQEPTAPWLTQAAIHYCVNYRYINDDSYTEISATQ